jgi:hypothetical protein
VKLILRRIWKKFKKSKIMQDQETLPETGLSFVGTVRDTSFKRKFGLRLLVLFFGRYIVC